MSSGGTNRCRLPAEGGADTGPRRGNLSSPRHVAPWPAEPNSLGKFFDFLKLVNDFPAETNRCRLPGEGAADPGPPPRNLSLPRHVAPWPAEPNSLGNIFDFLKLVNDFPCWLMSSAAETNRCRLPAEGGADTGPRRGNLSSPRHVAPWPAEPNSLGKFFDFLKLVNDFPAQTNRCRLPGEGAADTGPPPRNLSLPRDLAPRPAEPNSLGNIFDFLKLVNDFPLVNEFAAKQIAAGCPAKVLQTPDHHPGTCPYPGTLPPGRRNRIPSGKFSTF